MEQTRKPDTVEKKDTPPDVEKSMRQRAEEIVSFLLNRYIKEREKEKKDVISRA